MASETNASVPDDRPPWISAAAVSAGFAIVGAVLWSPVSVGILQDDAVYVLLSKALANGDGLRYSGVPGSPPGAKFPPLYPLVLAALWRILPSFPDNVMVFEALNVGFLALAAGLFTAFQQRFVGLGATFAVATSVLGFVGIYVWQVVALPLSEPLFLLLAVGALWASAELERSAQPAGPGPLLWAFLALSVAAVAYTRTAGVVFPLALCVALVTRRRLRHAAIVLGILGVTLLPWVLWSGRAARAIPFPMRDILGPYGPWLVAQIVGDPWAYAERLTSEASLLTAHFATAVLPDLPPPIRWFALITVAPVLALGARVLWSRSRTSLLALVAYLALSWLWPFKDFRLIVPALPLLALLFVSGAHALWAGEKARSTDPSMRATGSGSRTSSATPSGGVPPGDSLAAPRRAPIRRLGLGVAAAWSGWFLMWTALALARGEHRAGFAERSALLFDAAQVIVRQLPPDAVVGAPDAWAAIALYTGRQAAPSARFLPLSNVGPRWGTPDEQLELWHAAGLDFLLVEWGGLVHGETLEALRRRCGESAFTEVRSLRAGAALVDLRPSAACDAVP